MAILSNVMEQGNLLKQQSTEMGKTILLAGLGVVSFVEERSKGVLDNLVGKGQDFQKDELASFTDRVQSLKSNVTTNIQKKESLMEEKFQGLFTGLLHRVGVPTKDEVRNLIVHVEELTKKVEELKKEKVSK